MPDDDGARHSLNPYVIKVLTGLQLTIKAIPIVFLKTEA